MDGWIGLYVSEWLYGSIRDERNDERLDKGIDGWTNRCMNGWMYGWVGE